MRFGVERIRLIEGGIEAQPGAKGENHIGALYEIRCDCIAPRPHLASIDRLVAGYGISVTRGHGYGCVQKLGQARNGLAMTT